MSLLIESIRLHNGIFHNLRYHEQRMNRSLRELVAKPFSVRLAEFLDGVESPRQGLYKCRIVYNEQNAEVEFVPYVVRHVHTIRVVEDNTISYDHKFLNRTHLDRLFAKRDGCDDVLVVRNGLITDASYANIVLSRDGNWFTPEPCLLEGTMRQLLIDSGRISPAAIRKEEVFSFETFKLVNAMTGFDGPEVNVANIIF